MRDDLSRLRGELLRRRVTAGLSREALADRAGVEEIDVEFIRYLETKRVTLPPRRAIEPLARELGLPWRGVLELL